MENFHYSFIIQIYKKKIIKLLPFSPHYGNLSHFYI